jgi:hypothetical protein
MLKVGMTVSVNYELSGDDDLVEYFEEVLKGNDKVVVFSMDFESYQIWLEDCDFAISMDIVSHQDFPERFECKPCNHFYQVKEKASFKCPCCLNILKTTELYPLEENESIMMSSSNRENPAVRIEGWHIYKNAIAPLKILKRFTEREAIELIIEKYKQVCKDIGGACKLISIDDIKSHSDIEFMIEALDNPIALKEVNTRVA